MKKLLRLLLTTTIIGFCGCSSLSPKAAVDQQNFKKVSAYLHTGGSCYAVSTPRIFFAKADDYLNRLKKTLLSADLSDSQRSKYLSYITIFELCIQVIGVHEVEVVGCSSVEVSPNCFHNRAILLAKPNAKGLLWNVWGDENSGLPSTLFELSSDVTLAAGAQLRFDVLLNKLKHSGELGRNLLEYIPKELLSAGWESNYNGWWCISSIELDDAPDMMKYPSKIEIPDSKKLLFNWIAKEAKKFPQSKISADTVELPYFSKSIKPKIYWKNGKFVVYLSELAEKRFKSSEQKLAQVPLFQQLSSQIPKNAIAYVFDNEPKKHQSQKTELLFKGTFPPSSIDSSSFDVISRVDNGLLFLSNSHLDYNGFIWANFVDFPIFLIDNYGEKLIKWVISETQSHPKNVAVKRNKKIESTQVPLKFEECCTQIKLLKKGLNDYARQHDGVFPKAKYFGGLLELIRSKFLKLEDVICPATKAKTAVSVAAFMWENCSYIYFSGWNLKSSSKLPLIVDWPKNHKNKGFNVLYVDGSCETIKMERPVNLRRMISYLYNRYRYQEVEFRSLMAQAEEIDKMFGMD